MIRFCVKCVISSARPRITFDAEGVCSACRFAEVKARTDWTARENELKPLCDAHPSPHGSFDVIVPVSGGKDGGFVAHQLKTVYGMTPLCVTWAPLLPTDIGRQNLDAFVAHGFDVIQGRPNGQTTRTLARLSFQHMGDPFLPFIYGQTNFPLQMAVRYQIPLIMYGEDGEAVYGGMVKEPRAQRRIEDHDAQYFSGKPPQFWTAHGLSEAALQPFQPPPYGAIKANDTQIHFFGYYKPWSPQENFYYAVENLGFTPNPERTIGTWSKYSSLDDVLDFLHYHMAFVKFGIGRATSDSAQEIRDGRITREEGIALVKKFDGEFSDYHWHRARLYMDITDKEGREIINKWKAPEIWDGQDLKYAVWK